MENANVEFLEKWELWGSICGVDFGVDLGKVAERGGLTLRVGMSFNTEDRKGEGGYKLIRGNFQH